MARTRMKAREVQTTARSLEKSLKSTLKGLETLLESLERSGFRDAVSPYQQMQLVLLQQRLWTQDNRRFELRSLWRKIAATAREIYDILAPFSAIMAEIKDLDRIDSNDKTTTRDDSSQQAELLESVDDTTIEFVELFLEGLSVSNFKLSNRLSWQDEVRKSRLKALTAAGVLERRGWGRGQSYTLTPASRQRIVQNMGEILMTGRDQTKRQV